MLSASHLMIALAHGFVSHLLCPSEPRVIRKDFLKMGVGSRNPRSAARSTEEIVYSIDCDPKTSQKKTMSILYIHSSLLPIANHLLVLITTISAGPQFTTDHFYHD